MPVRTHRGRAAVYRRAWGWPLRSTHHLAAAAAALTVLGIGLGLTLPALGTDDDPGSREPAVAGPTGYQLPTTTARDYITSRPNPTGSRSAPAAPASPTPPATGAVPAGVLTTADAFARGWVNHPPGITTAQWLQQLRPYATPGYLRELAAVDPAAVPASTITGPPVVADAGSVTVDVDVPTDALILRLTLVDTGSVWRVADYTRANRGVP